VVPPPKFVCSSDFLAGPHMGPPSRALECAFRENLLAELRKVAALIAALPDQVRESKVSFQEELDKVQCVVRFSIEFQDDDTFFGQGLRLLAQQVECMYIQLGLEHNLNWCMKAARGARALSAPLDAHRNWFRGWLNMWDAKVDLSSDFQPSVPYEGTVGTVNVAAREARQACENGEDSDADSDRSLDPVDWQVIEKDDHETPSEPMDVIVFVSQECLGGESACVAKTSLESRTVDAVLRWMHEHLETERKFLEGCCCLLALVQEEGERCQEMMNLGGVEITTRAMRTHMSSQEVQRAGCALLEHLSSCEEGCRLLDSVGGAELLHLAMSGHLADAEVQRFCCRSLANLAQHEGKSTTSRLAGMRLVLQSMKRHEEDVEVQRAACEALSSLSLCRSIRQNVGELGGVEAVLNAMSGHRQDAHVQQTACRALWIFLLNEGNRKLHVEDVILLVVQAMDLHMDVQVQSAACAVLQNLALHHQNRPLIVEFGGLGALLVAMRRYPNEVDVQRWGGGALGNLSRDPEIRPYFVDVNGAELVVSAMENHKNDPQVLLACGSVLWNLALDKHGCQLIGDHHGIHVVTQALRNHPMSVEVTRMSCGVLWKLALNAENVRRIQELGGDDLAQEALEKHLTDDEVHRLATEALAKLRP